MSIYRIYGQKIKIDGKKIKIGFMPFSAYQMRMRITLIFLSLFFIFVLALSQIFVGLSCGLATSFSYFEIENEKQLYMALNSNGSYKLTSDIEVEQLESINSFCGELDGNNHILKINSLSQNCFINKNTGIIKNLRLVYSDDNVEINNSISLFIFDNYGTIENISISCGSINFIVNKSENSDIYLSLVALNNYGIIQDCKSKIECNIDGRLNGNCYFSSMAGINNNIIKNCVFLNTSSVVANEVDIAGIVCENKLNAQVLMCKNYATIKQISSSQQWSPNVGGVSINNYGLIKDSKNYAELSIISDCVGEEAQGSAFLAGIASFNYNDISDCLNKGKLTVSSKKIIIYCGGIVAYSSYYSEGNNSYISTINNCGVNCQIELSTEDEKSFVFAGGISGYFYGQMIDCYTMATYVNGNNKDKYFIGSVIGLATVQYHLFGSSIYAEFKNVYALSQDNISYQIGALVYDGNIVSVGIDNSEDKIIVTDEKTILEQEIYWDEN